MELKNQAPLSELLGLHHAAQTDRTYVNFLNAFLTSKLGVHAKGAPADFVGDFVSTRQKPVFLGCDGSYIVACADPAVFAVNFDRRFNAEMWGDTILWCVTQDPECYGVRVNSALTELSLIIDRPTIISLAQDRKLTHIPAPRPWWKLC